MYSVEDQILADEYQSVLGQLDSAIANQFAAVLEDFKLNVTFYRLDHKKIDARKGESIDTLLTQLCVR